MLLWSGEALSQLGSQASTVAFPLLVLALTGSAAKAGIVGLAKWVPLAAAALPAGLVADRFDRKRLMIGSDAARALLLASIPVALWLGRAPFGQIVGVAFADGCLFTLRYICERGVLPRIVEQEQLPDAVAQNEARLFAAGIVGPPLGGLLFAAGRALPFVADAVSYVASMTTVMATRFQPGARVADRGGGLGAGLAWIWRSPFFRTTTLLFAAGNPLFSALYLLAILLAKRHGASSGAVGLMFAIAGAGGLLGAVVAGSLSRRVAAHTALRVEAWVIASLIAVLFVAQSAPLIGLIVGGAELLTPLANAIVGGRRVALTPDHLRGRVQAAAVLSTMSLAWVGPLAVGFLFQHAGATATVAAVAGWAAVVAVATSAARGLRQSPPLAATIGGSTRLGEGEGGKRTSTSSPPG